jgi:predicted AAA+ superfamily ATPase
MSSLAKALNVNRDTISEYINYLELSFLLDTQANFTKSTIKQMRTLKKIHLAHPCIATAIRRHTKSEMALDELCGKYVESVVYQALNDRFEHVNFYRNAKNEEVDVVIRQNEKVLPIEVKFQNRIGLDDFNGLMAFFVDKKVRFGLMITKSRFELVKLKGVGKVQLVPLWLFLLCI